MAEFEDKLAAILGNEAAMGQIMALAQSFSGGAPSDVSPSPESEQGEWEPVETDPPSQGGSLPVLGDLDPRLLQLGMRLLGEYRGDNSKNLALLSAIRPFIRSEKYEKLDKAIQLARLSRVIRVAFQSLGEGGADV